MFGRSFANVCPIFGRFLVDLSLIFPGLRDILSIALMAGIELV
jgi:hypothetical protein